MAFALLYALLALAPHGREGDAQAFTALTDQQGRPLADSRYSQWVEGDRLHIEARSDFPSGRSVVEHAILRLRPRLEQESWDWTERDGKRLVREYLVDFRTGKAMATRVDQGKRWKEDLEIEPGKTFAGIAFVPVVKALRAQLTAGQQVELIAVAMTPRPRTAKVTVRRDGPSIVHMAGRTIEGDRYTIHPEIPAIARLFVKAPDLFIWLVADDPPAFLRFEGPLVEPGDQVVRIDLIPGAAAHAQGRSAPARPR
jgi:hypothetical protein